MWFVAGAYISGVLKLRIPLHPPYFIHAVSQQVFVECLFCAGLWVRLGDSKGVKFTPPKGGTILLGMTTVEPNKRVRSEGTVQGLGSAIYSHSEISKQVPRELQGETKPRDSPVPCLRPWMSLTELVRRTKSENGQ